MDRLLLRVEEAAERAGLSRSTGYELVASGEWPSIKVGRSRRVPVAALVSWIERELERSARIEGSVSGKADVACTTGAGMAPKAKDAAGTGGTDRRVRATTKVRDVSVAGGNDG